MQMMASETILKLNFCEISFVPNLPPILADRFTISHRKISSYIILVSTNFQNDWASVIDITSVIFCPSELEPSINLIGGIYRVRAFMHMENTKQIAQYSMGSFIVSTWFLK